MIVPITKEEVVKVVDSIIIIGVESRVKGAIIILVNMTRCPNN